ncbi:MAG: hypothetical protein WA705_09065 [Candidatus Ozemobacteraceae bacterium]
MKKIEHEFCASQSENSFMGSGEASRQILDYFKKSENEYFFRTDDGLYYACITGSSVSIDRLFWRSLGQIEPKRLFSHSGESFIIFENSEMKKGIVTEWYSILEISSKTSFQKDNFYQMCGFSKDEEASGENGIESGEEMLKFEFNDIDNDRFPEIVFTIVESNYKDKTFQRKLCIFKKTETQFKKWKDIPIFSK